MVFVNAARRKSTISLKPPQRLGHGTRRFVYISSAFSSPRTLCSHEDLADASSGDYWIRPSIHPLGKAYCHQISTSTYSLEIPMLSLLGRFNYCKWESDHDD